MKNMFAIFACAAFSPCASADMSTSSGQGGTRTPSLLIPINGANSFREEVNGFNTLRWRSVSAGSVDNGSAYIYYFTVEGDYSLRGQVTGGHESLNLHPDFAVITNFVYDANTNTTTLLALSDSYVNPPSLDVRFYGSPVPGPASAALTGLVLALSARCLWR